MSGWLGVGLGLAGGSGLALVVAGLPGHRPRLDDRIAPYLGGSVAGRRSTRVRGGWTGLAPTLDRALGGGASVRRRLLQAGREPDVDGFRRSQVLWGAVALAAALGLSGALLAGGAARRPGALVVLCAVAAVAGVLARDRALSREVVRREARMLAELPTLAELLALAVSAGEGAVGALERVAAVGHGELARELDHVLADARAGASLTEALGGLARRTGLPALARFVDGVAVALERGTPLADVLRAQATDAREAGRRALLEAGGRREIAMMVPVVFLILPVTVVFALYPGWFALHLYAP